MIHHIIQILPQVQTGILPMLAIAAAQAAMEAGKAIFGGIQAGKARKELNKLQRPKLAIPQEAIQALQNAQKQSLMTTLPGQDIMQQQIGSNVQANVNALGEVATGGALLEGANRAYQTGARQISDLDIAAAQFNQANQAAYRQQLGQMSALKERQFQINELDPYNQRYQELTNQRQAGQANLWGGVQGVVQAGATLAQMKQEQSQFDTMMGLNQRGNSTQGTVSQMTPITNIPIPQTQMQLQRPQIRTTSAWNPWTNPMDGYMFPNR